MSFYLKVKLNLNPYINRESVTRLYKAVWCCWFTECSHHRQWLWEIWHGNQCFVYAYYIKKQWALLLLSSPISEELFSSDLQLPDFPALPAAEEQKNHPLPLQLTCQCTRQSYSTKPTFWPHSPPSAFHRRKKVRHTSWLTILVSNSKVNFEFLFFSAPQSQELIFTSLTMPKHCDAAATWLMSVCLRDFQWGVH